MKKSFENLEALRRAAHNTSRRPAARLKAALAQIEFNKLYDSLPGSVRRGWDRRNHQ